MENTIIVAKFEGRLADAHRLPAYEATESMFGIAKAITMSGNYLFENRVRRRKFEKRDFRLDILTQRDGSFETVFDFIFDPANLGVITAAGLATGVASNFATDFIKSTFNRAVGKPALDSIQAMEDDRALSGGDIAALVEAIEPALRQAHKSIGGGASSITINTGDHSPVVFNQSTKTLINHNEVDNSPRIKNFSVGSFNANTGYGRVFDYEEGRTVPFQLPKTVDRMTLDALLFSFNGYSRTKLNGADDASSIYIRYTALEASDGTVKRIYPILARKTLEEFPD